MKRNNSVLFFFYIVIVKNNNNIEENKVKSKSALFLTVAYSNSKVVTTNDILLENFNL